MNISYIDIFYFIFSFVLYIMCNIWLKMESVAVTCCTGELHAEPSTVIIRNCFIFRPLSTHTMTFRPNPQGLNPERNLWGFFQLCRHAVCLPLPTPRVPSELPRVGEDSQGPCTGSGPSIWVWKQDVHRLISAELESRLWVESSGPPEYWIPPSRHCYPLLAEHWGVRGNVTAMSTSLRTATFHINVNLFLSVFMRNTSSLGWRSQPFMPRDRVGQCAARWR